MFWAQRTANMKKLLEIKILLNDFEWAGDVIYGTSAHIHQAKKTN